MIVVKRTLTCVGLALMVSSCASNLTPSSGSSQSVSSAPATANTAERAIAQRVYSLVNTQRASAGKQALRGHGALNFIAQKHCVKLSNGYTESGHAARESRSQYAYLKHNVQNMNEVTYKVPANTADPAGKAVAAWTRSQNGTSSILQPWHVVGVGVKSTPNTTYITMCLGAQPTGVPRSISPIGW